MDSIIQAERTHCYICCQNASVEPLDCHHIFGASNRDKSEKYGLKVYLHHNKCHIFGRNSVHQNADINRALKAEAQKIAMAHYGWSVEDFIKIFGKNYL